MRGTLFLVVGPSGAGKDTLIGFAKQRLCNDRQFHFARRVITRVEHAGGEEHLAVSESEFRALSSAGGFMLEWEAHGLSYGIPGSALRLLGSSTNVVANVSRSVLDRARRDLQPVRVISVSVSPDILRSRLMARGREASADIEDRLARAAAFTVAGADVVRIANEGPPEAGGAAFLRALGA